MAPPKKKTAAKKPASKKPAAKKAASKQPASKPSPKKKPLISTRNRLVLIFVMLAIGASGYTLLWQAVARRLEANTGEALIRLADQGYRIDHSGIDVTGFPYRLVVTFKEPRFETQSGSVGLKADRISGASHLWTPNQWVLDASMMRFSSPLFQDFEAPTATASWRRLGETGQRIVVDAKGATMGKTQFDRAILGLLIPGEAERAESEALLGDKIAAITLGLTAGSIKTDITSVLSGVLITDWTAQSLNAWRDAGGLYEISKLTFDQGAGQMLDGSASLALDLEGHVLGTLDLKPLDRASPLPPALKKLLPAVGALDRSVSISFQNGSYYVDGDYRGDLKKVLKN